MPAVKEIADFGDVSEVELIVLKKRRTELENPVQRAICDILESEGPCSETKLLRLLREIGEGGQLIFPLGVKTGKNVMGEALFFLRSSSDGGQPVAPLVKPCYYPGKPPDAQVEEALVGPGTFGYFLAENEKKLMAKGVLGQSRKVCDLDFVQAAKELGFGETERFKIK